VRIQDKADQAFQITKLQQEKAQLAADLEQARLVIADLRYAQWKKDVQMEQRIAFYKNFKAAAERAREQASDIAIHRSACPTQCFSFSALVHLMYVRISMT
jgi:hypothetical protein